MNKPLTMIIKETKSKLANVCNESGLPFAVLDLVVKDFYLELRSLAERQSLEEETAYINTIKEENKKDKDLDSVISEQDLSANK